MAVFNRDGLHIQQRDSVAGPFQHVPGSTTAVAKAVAASGHEDSLTRPVGQFVEGRLAAKAPGGTVGVRFQVLLAAAGMETGSIVVDDAKLVILD